MARFAQFPGLGQVCRLGLATRGNTHLDLQSVNEAIHRGINYVNWCGRDDGLSQAIASMNKQQRQSTNLYLIIFAKPLDVIERFVRSPSSRNALSLVTCETVSAQPSNEPVKNNAT